MEKKKTGISYVFQLAKDERKKLHLGMFLSVISAALSLVPYFVVYKILLMIFQKNISYTEILMWAGIGITSAVLQAILMSFAGILSHTAAFNTIHRVKLKVVNHISKFNLGFFQEHAPGEIKTLLFDDVDRVENFLAHSTLELAQVAVVPVIMFIFMLKLNWMMALVMLIPMILGLGVPMMLMKNYPDMSTELSEDIADLNASANEFIKAMPVIKMYQLTAEKFEQYRNSLNAYIACWKKMCMSSCYPLSITLVVLDSAILFTLPFGGYFFLRNSLSATSYLLFIMLTMCFFVSFLNMVTIFMQSMELGSGLNNIKKIMDMDELKDGTKIINKNECIEIDFKDVTFSYGDEETKNKALQHINLSLKPNTINAFVGASGAGKTTAAQLIGRYWDVTSGAIKINDLTEQVTSPEAGAQDLLHAAEQGVLAFRVRGSGDVVGNGNPHGCAGESLGDQHLVDHARDAGRTLVGEFLDGEAALQLRIVGVHGDGKGTRVRGVAEHGSQQQNHRRLVAFQPLNQLTGEAAPQLVGFGTDHDDQVAFR